jgi:hypothetical protein
MTVIIKYAFLWSLLIIYHIKANRKNIRTAGVPSYEIPVKKGLKGGASVEINFCMISLSKLSVCPKTTRNVSIAKDKNKLDQNIIKNNLDRNEKSKSESMFDRDNVLI